MAARANETSMTKAGLTLTLALGSLVALAAAPASAAPATGKLEKTVLFVGFSSDESEAAWQLKVERFSPAGPGRTIDQYAVVRIVDVGSNTTLGTYRYGDIQRVDKSGRKLAVGDEDLAAANDLWAEAAPAADWAALESEYQFAAVRLSAATAVEVRPDPDVDLNTRPGRSGTLEARSDSNNLGYTLVTTTGKKTVLGRYRHEAKVGQRVVGKIELLTALNRDYVAVVNRFDITGADPNEPSTLTYGKIVPIKRGGALGDAGPVWVRTLTGWKQISSAEERLWQEAFSDNLALAELLHRMANGEY